MKRPVLTRRHALIAIPAVAAPLSLGWLAFGGRMPHEPGQPHIGDVAGRDTWRTLSRVTPAAGLQGPAFGPEIEALDGRRVRLGGFMATMREAPAHSRFVLTASPLGCPACVRPSVGAMAEVASSRPVPHTREPLIAEGTLRLRRLSVGLVYALEDAVVGPA